MVAPSAKTTAGEDGHGHSREKIQRRKSSGYLRKSVDKAGVCRAHVVRVPFTPIFPCSAFRIFCKQHLCQKQSDHWTLCRKMETTSHLTTAAREITFSRRNGKCRSHQGDHQHNWVNRVTLLAGCVWQHMPLVSNHHQLCLCSDVQPKPVLPTNWCKVFRSSGSHWATCLPALQPHIILVAISHFFSKLLVFHQTNHF